MKQISLKNEKIEKKNIEEIKKMGKQADQEELDFPDSLAQKVFGELEQFISILRNTLIKF